MLRKRNRSDWPFARIARKIFALVLLSVRILSLQQVRLGTRGMSLWHRYQEEQFSRDPSPDYMQSGNGWIGRRLLVSLMLKGPGERLGSLDPVISVDDEPPVINCRKSANGLAPLYKYRD
jgi:hypothetical protein